MAQYIAALCHMEGTEYVPFDEKHIDAPSDKEAIRAALEWRIGAITMIDRETWLQVMCAGRSVYCKSVFTS